MRRVVAILFSFVLVYGGVAWALGKCLSHHSKHEHPIKDRDSHSHTSTNLFDSRDSSWPVIHCPPAEMRIGPAAQSSPTHLSRPHRIATLHAPLLHEAAALAFRNSHWLDAVFRRMPASFYPKDLGRHLLFSILQI
jgi:hypothetical protein